jgi:4'-phosphopantetheinyl transferase
MSSPSAGSSEDLKNYAKKTDYLTIRLCPGDTALLPAQRRAYRALLPDSERVTESRLPPDTADSYLLTRALLRSELAEVTGEAPQSLQLRAGRHGKPFLAQGPCFNLSHTAGWIALGIAPVSEIGVDIEAIAPRSVDPLRLARRFFTPSEARALARQSPRQQLVQFYALWTLKEAWAKSLGEPVVKHLSELEIDFTGDQLSARHHGLPISASIALLQPSPGVSLALCVRNATTGGTASTLQLSSGLPLQGGWQEIAANGLGTRLFSHLRSV